MDGWTNISLPDRGNLNNHNRMHKIAEWVANNDLDETGIAISARIVRFRNAEEATLFIISFKGAI